MHNFTMLYFAKLLLIGAYFGIPFLSAETDVIQQKSAFSSNNGDAIGVKGVSAQSTVRIVVGEQNGFAYTVDGRTDSPYRISTSGDYYNNADTRSGFTRLILGIQYPIKSYKLRLSNDERYLYVDILDGYNYAYYFQVDCPYPVSSKIDLRQGQINSTAIIVVGPSRSSGYSTS